jgi:exodeoxyribonuclease VII large subunit
LKEEGIYDAKARTSFITAKAGNHFSRNQQRLRDFLNVIDNNNWNYKFFYLLFPSILQGDKAVTGIAQLDEESDPSF